MLILQYNGAVAQTVTVPADGIYSVAFSHLLRSTYPENQVYVTLDGVLLASFLNRSVQFSPGRFASGALFLKAGAHTLGIGGEGGWGDRSTMVDAVCFAAPAASTARAISAMSVTFGVSFTMTGRSVSDFTIPVTSAAASGRAPNAIPPFLTFGQEMFTSMAWTPPAPLRV